MKKNKTLSIALILSLLMGLMTTGMAFASEGNEIEVEGTIVGIYADEFYLEVEAEIEGEIVVLEVEVGQNFNFDAYDIGDLLELKGTLNEEGRLVVTELKIQERARDRVQTQDGELVANYCAVEDEFHPVGFKIADTYGVDYEEIEGYLCGEEHVSLGKLMLALQTADLAEGSYLDYLLTENISWGKIWQDLGVKGKPDHGTAPGQIKQGGSDSAPEDPGNAPEDPGNAPQDNGK